MELQEFRAIAERCIGQRQLCIRLTDVQLAIYRGLIDGYAADGCRSSRQFWHSTIRDVMRIAGVGADESVYLAAMRDQIVQAALLPPVCTFL